MAEAAAKSVLGTISRGHLECPICCCRFADPKILDCLHNFCLNCLLELISRQQPKADEITCPVCRRVTAVPDTGLQGLHTCFFLSNLVDEFNKQERLLGDAPTDAPTCEECDEGLEAVSKCLDCCKLICTKCLEAHERMKSMRYHRIIGKEEHKFPEALIGPRMKGNLKCNKHHDQDICLYCETCKTLACAACAALDHRGAEHEYREVADVIRSYRQDVGEILQRFEQNREEFKVADDSLSHARNRLRIKVARACEDITTKEEEEISKIRNKSRLLRDKVTQIGEARDRKFEEVQKGNNAKMERAEHIVALVNDLLQQADDFELLDLKPKVTHNLEFQEELEFEKAQHELSFIGVKCQDIVADSELGEILQEENWQIKVEFGNRGPEVGRLQCAVDVACLSNGDIAVTDIEKRKLMMFNTCTGEYKDSVAREHLKCPLSVAVTIGGLLLVTDGKSVKVLDSGQLFNSHADEPTGFTGNAVDKENRIATSPNNSNEETGFTGIAVDKENRVAVADSEIKMIYLHHPDGSLIRPIPNDMVGGGLAIGIRERLIFTNVFERKLICITYTGDEVFKVNTSLEGKTVRPFGLCCDDAGDIYVSVGIKEGESSESSGGFDSSCEVHHEGSDENEGGEDSEGSEDDEGSAGSEGDDGRECSEGDDDSEGDDGREGDDGSEGGAGDDGTERDDGGAGDDGREGSEGNDGREGSVGDDGREGSEGDDGREGSEGDDGREGGSGGEGGEGDDGSEGGEGDDGSEGGEGDDGREGGEGDVDSEGDEGSEVFDSYEVHHYSPNGVFIGRLALRLYNPYGLTFTQSGDLVVADKESVKIFQRV